MQELESVLSVVGAISIVVSIFRFIWLFFSFGTEWIDNLSILVEDYDEDVDYDEYFAFEGKSIYPTVFKDTDCEPNYPSVNFFIPQNTIIRKVKIKKVSDESIADGSMKYKTVKVIESITPHNPLCMIVGRGECVARYKLCWKPYMEAKRSTISMKICVMAHIINQGYNIPTALFREYESFLGWCNLLL